jgi:hypothetical protein
MPALLTRFAQLRAKAQERTGAAYPPVMIQEAGSTASGFTDALRRTAPRVTTWMPP